MNQQWFVQHLYRSTPKSKKLLGVLCYIPTKKIIFVSNMLQSMTGYGNAITEVAGKRLTLEIRSLNGKQFDVNFRAPLAYKSEEMKLRKTLSNALKRGKVDVYLSADIIGEVNVKINRPFVESYAKELQSISKDLNLPQSEILRITMTLPNALLSDIELDPEESKGLESLCKKAVEKLIVYRKQEGQVLQEDFEKRITAIQEKLEKVETLAPERVARVRDKMTQALNSLILNKTIDENRFEQELIFYLEKLDINEEVVRLRNNCQIFLDELNAPSITKGKKLSFISQELGREINTIGSKANDKDIQKIVVEMKDELEKIKEQMANVL